jgi:DNA-binding MarR family transcriptional regulator
MPTSTAVATGIGELRLALAQLTRRLRAEHLFPIGHVTVLGRLEREGPLTTSKLAAAEHVRPQSMSQTVSELFEEGLVTRHPHPTDRRGILIKITADGREILARERARREGWLAAAVAQSLSPAEQRTLLAAVPLLSRLANLSDSR